MSDSNVQVTVTADTSDLRAELAIAQAQARAFSGELTNMARAAVTAGTTTDAALRNSLAQTPAPASTSAAPWLATPPT